MSRYNVRSQILKRNHCPGIKSNRLFLFCAVFFVFLRELVHFFIHILSKKLVKFFEKRNLENNIFFTFSGADLGHTLFSWAKAPALYVAMSQAVVAGHFLLVLK